jgi:hypothetical protein
MVRKMLVPLFTCRDCSGAILMGLYGSCLADSQQDALDAIEPLGLCPELFPSHLRCRRISPWARPLRQARQGDRRAFCVAVSLRFVATRCRIRCRCACPMGLAAGHPRLSYSLRDMAVAELEHLRPSPNTRTRRTLVRSTPRLPRCSIADGSATGSSLPGRCFFSWPAPLPRCFGTGLAIPLEQSWTQLNNRPTFRLH